MIQRKLTVQFFSCQVQNRQLVWQPTPVLFPGKSHGQRSLVGYSPWGGEESDMIDRLHYHFSLSCIGEGNGNPFQCSCLENPRTAESGGLPSTGSQSRTWLKRLSSSNLWSYFPFLDLCCYLAYFWFFKLKVKIVFLRKLPFLMPWYHYYNVNPHFSLPSVHCHYL